MTDKLKELVAKWLAYSKSPLPNGGDVLALLAARDATKLCASELSALLAEQAPAGEWAWLIERGGLCLGFCEHRFSWVTFTNDNALRFARSHDAYNFMETVKWTPFNLPLENAIVTEHLWYAGQSSQPAEPRDPAAK